MAEKLTETMDVPERFKMGESGYLGLNLFNGVTQDELKRELNFPRSLKTFKEMTYHSTINSAVTLYHNLISKVDWSFKPPIGATDEEKRQCKIIEEMMHDMDQPWEEFVSDVLSAYVYGFCINEKVYRRRLRSSGSKFDDGLIGWKKLPIRNQETIEKFIFSEDGNEIKGVKQNANLVSDVYNRYTDRLSKDIVMPRSKFLLFRVGKHKGDPFGKSPLRDAYAAWRYLTIIEEIEANGAAKDLVGLPVLKIPPQYLSADATPEQKAIYTYYQNAMRNLQLNQQSSLILPNAYDPDTREPLFSLELLSLEGKKGMDTSKIKEYYKNLILTSLFADILVMGQSATGSFALGQIKNTLSGTAAESTLRSIVAVLDNDLARQTYELNGWDVSRMGHFDYDNLESEDLETFSKAVMRFASTSSVEADRDFLNRVRVSMGIDPLPADLEPQKDYMPNFKSASGQGSAAGGMNGTSNQPSGTDTSSANGENVG
jgi:hypothetical protein